MVTRLDSSETDVRAVDKRETPNKRAPLALRIALAEYDRTRPLLDGRVRFKDLDATLITEPMGNFCRRPVYEEFDVCEMSMSWFLAARSRGEPVIGLPIFPCACPCWPTCFAG